MNENIKHDYFDVIDTPDKAYWLGLFITDGSVRRGREIYISLIDKNVLEELKQTQHQVANKIKGIVKNPELTYTARINHNHKNLCLGTYKTKIEAVNAYNNYVILHKLSRSLSALPAEGDS